MAKERRGCPSYLETISYFGQKSKKIAMPTNKNALLRYQVLNNCFGNPYRKYFIQDLIAAVNDALADEGCKVGRSQIYNDIKYMESELGYRAPIKRLREGHKVYMRYDPIDFSIHKTPLGPKENAQLEDALNILERLESFQSFDWLTELLPKIKQKLGFARPEQASIIFFDENKDYQGLEHLRPLFTAIKEEQCLRIAYQSFREESGKEEFNFHPQVLKQYNKRWFVFGRDEDRDFDYRNLALDRIQKLEDSLLAYKKVEIDWENDFFKDIIGVSKDWEQQKEEIKIWVAAEQAPYTESKPIHSSQKLLERREDGSIVISLELRPNYELQQQLLMAAEKYKVLSPASLQTLLYHRLKKAVERYEP